MFFFVLDNFLLQTSTVAPHYGGKSVLYALYILFFSISIVISTYFFPFWFCVRRSVCVLYSVRGELILTTQNYHLIILCYSQIVIIIIMCIIIMFGSFIEIVVLLQVYVYICIYMWKKFLRINMKRKKKLKSIKLYSLGMQCCVLLYIYTMCTSYIHRAMVYKVIKCLTQSFIFSLCSCVSEPT